MKCRLLGAVVTASAAHDVVLTCRVLMVDRKAVLELLAVNDQSVIGCRNPTKLFI